MNDYYEAKSFRLHILFIYNKTPKNVLQFYLEVHKCQEHLSENNRYTIQFQYTKHLINKQTFFLRRLMAFIG